MKINLEKEIHFKADPEHKSHYSWSLQEVDTGGQIASRDLIPWNWSVHFIASELLHTRSLEIKKEFSENNELKNLVEEQESICAVLYPGDHCLYTHPKKEPSYSMFGTARIVTRFKMTVKKLAKGDTNERCQLWGCVSYTSENDFREETTDDEVHVSLWIAPTRFENLVEDIKAGRTDIFQIRLSQVSGFYSEWSPSITTSRIKILADSKGQTVIASPERDDAPPRLGDVGKFSLTWIQQNKLTYQSILEESEKTDVDEDYKKNQHLSDRGEQASIVEKTIAIQEQYFQSLLGQMSRNEVEVSKVRVLLGITLGLLALISIKLWL